jgi:hypothetical protein
MGVNFTQPSSMLTGVTAWDGLSYSFDYNNARIVLLDQFMMANGTSASGNYQITPQQAWISAALAGRPAGGQAFVFGHKGMITENHVDTLFGADPSKDPAGQNAFISSLASNGVRCYMGGHDHMHNRSIVTTTDGVTAKVQDIIGASDSSKFYIPAIPSNDQKYDLPSSAFGRTRETPIAQELNTVGYYIFTVDGANVSVDFYSAIVNPTLVSGEYLLTTTPVLTFTKRETFSCGFTGQEKLVAEGASYVGSLGSYADGTSASILSGSNASTGEGRQHARTQSRVGQRVGRSDLRHFQRHPHPLGYLRPGQRQRRHHRPVDDLRPQQRERCNPGRRRPSAWPRRTARATGPTRSPRTWAGHRASCSARGAPATRLAPGASISIAMPCGRS